MIAHRIRSCAGSACLPRWKSNLPSFPAKKSTEIRGKEDRGLDSRGNSRRTRGEVLRHVRDCLGSKFPSFFDGFNPFNAQKRIAAAGAIVKVVRADDSEPFLLFRSDPRRRKASCGSASRESSICPSLRHNVGSRGFIGASSKTKRCFKTELLL